MVATILKTTCAGEMSVYVVRAFVQLSLNIFQVRPIPGQSQYVSFNITMPRYKNHRASFAFTCSSAFSSIASNCTPCMRAISSA
jgi:hypothetical protein